MAAAMESTTVEAAVGMKAAGAVEVVETMEAVEAVEPREPAAQERLGFNVVG
jgi:hypothetical protein